MGRPAGYQWQPLGWTEDPVPGEPAQISQEAQHLASVAGQIADQVRALKQIAADGTEIGAHADTIRSNAGSLATELDKLVGRYQQVSSILTSWVSDLEQAQSMSVQALDQAEGPYKQLNQTVALPGGTNLTPQEQQGIDNYHQAMRQAQGQLDDATALLNRAIALRDSSGSSHANQINNACNDGMRDHHSLWGSVESFFAGQFSFITKNWSQIVGDICTVLEVLATIAAIAAFVLAQFVPGLDIIADATLAAIIDGVVLGGTIATAVALGGRTLLAVTGHGSWMDVAMDAFALATFGLGRAAGAAGKSLVDGAEATAKLARSSELLTQYGAQTTRSMRVIDFITSAAERAPDVADGAKLTGFSKVMMNIGGFGGEEDTYARLMALGNRFASASGYTTAVRLLAGVTGISTATAGLTGITATVLNGLELDWGNWSGSLNIPATHNWYTRDFELTTGAPAGG